MNLIDLALTKYTESIAERADTADDLDRAAREEFLSHARSSAATNLCQDAAALDWQYVTADLPDQVEEARAILALERAEYLRYRIDNAAETAALELVQPCLVCRNDRVSPVTSLFHLGQLLNQEDEPHDQDADDTGAQEPGPLAAVEAAERRAASVAAITRQLLADHPDAGFIADTVAVFGHEDGDGSAKLRLKADSLDALRQVAAALGLEVTDRVSGTHPSMVLRHASADYTVDDIEVELRAHERLPQDQATAWHAQQNQPADGGEA